MRYLKITVAALSFLFFSFPVFAENNYCIDTPNTDVLDYGTYNLSFRLFSNGGILTRLDFGVFKVVNLGFGWETSNVIGTQDISVSPPALAIKMKLYEGGLKLPSVVVGYDGQGSFYDKNAEEYLNKEKGIYFALGRETVIPGLKLTAGANMYDFKTNIIAGFASAVYEVEEKFLTMLEYDNIHSGPLNRLNAGVRFSINESLSVDLAGRDIGAAGRTAERIIRVNYVGKF